MKPHHGSVRLSYLLVLGLISFLASCRPVAKSTSSDVQASGGSSRGELVPGTSYVLKDSLRRLIGSLDIVQSGVEDGAHVYTVSRVELGDIRSEANGVGFDVRLDFRATAKASQYVALGASAGANVSFSGVAAAKFRLDYDGRGLALQYVGLTWPSPLRSSVNVWTNARILAGVVRQKAHEKAAAAAADGMRQIPLRLESEIQKGLPKAQAALREYSDEIQAAMVDVPGAVPRLSSRQGEVVFEHLIPRGEGAAARLATTSPSGTDAGLSFSQDLFASLLNRSLAGRSFTLPDLRVAICQAFTKAHYRLCAQEEDQRPVEAKIAFEAGSPISVLFAGDKITLDLVARVGLKATEFDEGQIDSPRLKMTATYSKKARDFVLEDVQVKAGSSADDGILAKSPLFRGLLESSFKVGLTKALPQWITIPAVPSYLARDQRIRQVGGSFVVMNPDHFHARDGWLSTFFSYCSAADTRTALGISMKTTVDAKGSSRILVSGVKPGTPAARGIPTVKVDGFMGESADQNVVAEYSPAPGLMVGDVIYSVDGDEQIVTSPELFGGTLAARSLTKDHADARLLVGRKVSLPDPGRAGSSLVIWIMLKVDVELEKVCTKAQ